MDLSLVERLRILTDQEKIGELASAILVLAEVVERRGLQLPATPGPEELPVLLGGTTAARSRPR